VVPEEVYLPYAQQVFSLGMNIYPGTRGDPADMFATARQVVRQVDNSLVTERLMAMLSAVFGGLATVLAAMGLYGVMAYVVARRTREIGIRMALGANRRSVVWLVMREVIGLSSAWALTRLIESQLFEVKPSDPITLALATLGIATVAMLAGYVPAHRATGIDPTTALRFE
jgi:ABC-type antimicrobial peptide transport system permease subunit